MTEPIVPPPTPRRRGRWLRIISIAFGFLLLVVVAIYFVATSSAFFKGVILPRVSKAANAEISVSDASISPFKEVVLRDLKLRPAGQEPLVTAQEVRARYSLMDILKGNIHVEELTLASPTVVIIENPDGSHNYDPLTKAQAEPKPKAKETKETKPSKPAQLHLKNIALKDATIRYVKLYKGGNRDVVELSHVTITAADIKTGQNGKLNLEAGINIENNPPAPQTNGTLQAKLN